VISCLTTVFLNAALGGDVVSVEEWSIVEVLLLAKGWG
jgi:hypothetical protein